VQAQISRILRSITSRQKAGGLRAPPPIVSRIFQEISNGMLAYNHACKVKEVPVPFALVNFQALLLAFFNLTAPVVISCFTANLGMSIAASMVVVSGFCALWLVANELEDPFGYDDNDVSMTSYHVEFCGALDAALENPWLKRDYWTVKEGLHPCFRKTKKEYQRGSIMVGSIRPGQSMVGAGSPSGSAMAGVQACKQNVGGKASNPSLMPALAEYRVGE